MYLQETESADENNQVTDLNKKIHEWEKTLKHT